MAAEVPRCLAWVAGRGWSCLVSWRIQQEAVTLLGEGGCMELRRENQFGDKNWRVSGLDITQREARTELPGKSRQRDSWAGAEEGEARE